MSERPIAFTLDNGDVVTGVLLATDNGMFLRIDRIAVNRALSPEETAEAIRVAGQSGLTVAFTVTKPAVSC